jgi:DNA invertase Pin-like site-specific DNA recombinase
LSACLSNPGVSSVLAGYARTSTWDQTAGLAAQQRDLKAAGAEKVFSEQASSVAQRTKLNECLAFLRDGDALTVTKPDRLARSTTELLAIEADLSKRGVGLVVLSMGGERLDTRNPTSKLMLTILAGVATWEREIMLERQREGIAKAKAAGKYKGPPGQHRCGAGQAAEGHVGSRGDRQEDRHSAQQCLSGVGGIAAVSFGSGRILWMQWFQ